MYRKIDIMKVALFHPWIHTKGGAEKVVKEIAENSRHRVDIYTFKYKEDNTFESFKDLEVKEIGGIPIIGEIFRGASFGIASILTNLNLKEKRYDVFLISTGGIAELITYRNHEIPTLAFCHTPLRIANDPTIKRKSMEDAGFLKRQVLKIAILGYKVLEKPAWILLDYAVFNSFQTRNRALESNLVDKTNASVAYPGVNPLGKESKSFQKYVFYPSRFADYKRQELAVKAWKEFIEQNSKTDYKMILGGAVNEEKEDYFQEIQKKAEEVKNLEVKKNLPENEWQELYSNASAILFLAINEDWGIIPLEAGAYEKPFIAVKEGGFTEKINTEHGYFVDASATDIADKIKHLTENISEAKQKGRKGRENVQELTWDNFLEKVDDQILRAFANQNR